MRIVFLCANLSGYMNACLRELASRAGVEIFVAYLPPDPLAPFDPGEFAWITNQFVWRTSADLNSLDGRIEEFRPDAIVIAGWTVTGYRRIANNWRLRAVRIMAMDNCWAGTLKQRAGVALAPWFVRCLADAAWVPGERQASFALKLGFNKILRGYYTCDFSKFSAIREARFADCRNPQSAFIFVGRMVEEKGIADLTAAYKLYRSKTPNPWPLICCGAGPLLAMLEREQGVIVQGFVQPDQLPEALARATCLVLPSFFEPWALVVHEAAAAGLLIIASDAVGSVPHLVQDGYNGFTFRPRDVEGLAELMERIGQLSGEAVHRMSMASFSLAQQFTPERWADTLIDFVQRMTPLPRTNITLL